MRGFKFEYMRRILLVLLFALSSLSMSAQRIEYKSSLDSTFMLIGDQRKLSFELWSDNYVKVKFPIFADKQIIDSVEIISGPVRDSSEDKKTGRWHFSETYVITSFDTGVYIIPPFEINVEKDGFNSVFRTEQLELFVNTFKMDENAGLADIVMPLDVPWTFMEILIYVLYVLGGLLIIALIVWLIIRLKKGKVEGVSVKSLVPPYIRAIEDLNRLKEEKLWQSGHVKEYYIRLTDALRTYIEDELHVNAMEQTSFETLQALKNNPYISKEDYERLGELLSTSDFVKFAKMQPLPDSNSGNMQTAYELVEHVHLKIKEEESKVTANNE